MFDEFNSYEKKYEIHTKKISSNYKLTHEIYGGSFRNIYTSGKQYTVRKQSIFKDIKDTILSLIYLGFIISSFFKNKKICMHTLEPDSIQVKKLDEYFKTNKQKKDISTKKISVSLLTSFLIPSFYMRLVFVIFPKEKIFNYTWLFMYVNFRLRVAKLILKFYFKHLNIKYLITNGYTSPNSSLLMKVCKELNIISISISHGYIQNPILRTVYPINADMFLVWSTKQKKDIQKVLSLKDKKKIFYYGFPRKKLINKFKISTEYRYVFILPPIEKIIEDEKITSIFKLFVNNLLQDNKILFRCHPRDEISYCKKKLSSLIKLNYKKIFLVDEKSEYFSKDVFIGLGSSLLFELSHYNNLVFQLENSFWPNGENVSLISNYKKFKHKINEIKEYNTQSNSLNFLDQNWYKVFEYIKI